MNVVPTAVALLAIGMGGCATIDRGSTDKVYVASEPAGAKATASFGASCTTPCSLDASRTQEFTVTIEKAGYEPKAVSVTTQLAANGVGDFMENVATAGVGMVVDATTGATLEHAPNPVSVTLKKLPGRLR
jgi:hypothetical protein